MQNNYWKILVLFFFIGMSACERPPSKTKGEVIRERLEQRLAAWNQSHLDRCRKDVFDAATIIVDSTLLTDARLKRDLSDLPNIPGRPTRPGFDAPEDTTPIAPLLKFIQDSIFLDSLGYDSLQIDSILHDSIFLDSIR